MVRVQPAARDLITEEEYLLLGSRSPLNNCPGGIGPELRIRYDMFQLAKKEEALHQKRLAKWDLADVIRPPLSEKAQRRKEKREMGRNKKKNENMDSDASSKTSDEKLDTESKTPNEQKEPFVRPDYCPPELTRRLDRAAILFKELKAGNNTLKVLTELVLVENIIEKINVHFRGCGLFPRNWTYKRVTPRDYYALRSKFRMSV